MIEGLSQMWLIIGASVLMILCLVFGAVLMRKGKEEEERRERNRQRHKDKVKKGG
jgi:heme exporter protein D